MSSGKDAKTSQIGPEFREGTVKKGGTNKPPNTPPPGPPKGQGGKDKD